MCYNIIVRNVVVVININVAVGRNITLQADVLYTNWNTTSGVVNIILSYFMQYCVDEVNYFTGVQKK